MQWLIDLVIEAIGIPPVYIDRGDPIGADWAQGDLTLDATFNELDVSAIVPVNASAILFSAIVKDNAVASTFAMRKSGNVNTFNASGIFTTVANVFVQQDMIVAASSNQKVEYSGTAGFDVILLGVRGWWL